MESFNPPPKGTNYMSDYFEERAKNAGAAGWILIIALIIIVYLIRH